MSRSCRRTPIFGNVRNAARKGEKRDKQLASRKLRRRVHALARRVDEEVVLPLAREVANAWDFKKDGWFYDPRPSADAMRK